MKLAEPEWAPEQCTMGHEWTYQRRVLTSLISDTKPREFVFLKNQNQSSFSFHWNNDKGF